MVLMQSSFMHIPSEDTTNLRNSTSRTENLHFLRSEEHTSELQSQSNLVCRLLLEKKLRAAYINWLATTVTTDLSGLRVLADFANGAPTADAPELFRACHVKAPFIHSLPDGQIINTLPATDCVPL